MTKGKKVALVLLAVIAILTIAFFGGFAVRGSFSISRVDAERMGAELAAVHQAEIDELVTELEQRISLGDADGFTRKIAQLEAALEQQQEQTGQLVEGVNQTLVDFRDSIVTLRAGFNEQRISLVTSRQQILLAMGGAVGAELAALQFSLNTVEQQLSDVDATVIRLTVQIMELDAIIAQTMTA